MGANAVKKPKPSHPQAGRGKKAPSLEDLLERATTENILLDSIDVNDTTYSVRDQIKPTGDGESFVSENGVFDGIGHHSVIVQERPNAEQAYRILSGHQRIKALGDNKDITHVRCLVVRCKSEADVVAIAARINLSHGDKLSRDERFRGFERDWKACQAAGCKPLNKVEWANLYLVTRQTIHNWLDKIQTPAGVARAAASEGESVKVLHSPESSPRSTGTDAPSATPAALSGPDSGCSEITTGAGAGRASQAGGQAADSKTAAPRLPSVERIFGEFQAAAKLFVEDLAGRPLPATEHAQLQTIIKQLQAVKSIPAATREEAA